MKCILSQSNFIMAVLVVLFLFKKETVGTPIYFVFSGEITHINGTNIHGPLQDYNHNNPSSQIQIGTIYRQIWEIDFEIDGQSVNTNGLVSTFQDYVQTTFSGDIIHHDYGYANLIEGDILPTEYLPPTGSSGWISSNIAIDNQLESNPSWSFASGASYNQTAARLQGIAINDLQVGNTYYTENPDSYALYHSTTSTDVPIEQYQRFWTNSLTVEYIGTANPFHSVPEPEIIILFIFGVFTLSSFYFIDKAKIIRRIF
jgi:hypothetical protein